MRKILIAILLALLSLSADAQTKGKILVTCPGISTAVDSMCDAIKPHFHGEVVKHIGTLPDSLSSFDAVFIVDVDQGLSENLRTFSLLRNFLQQGGNLFFESQHFFFQEDTTFSQMMGVNKQMNAQMASDIDTIFGRDGYFTEGLSWSVQRKLFTDHPDILYITGPAEQVLYSCEAYQHQTDNYKVVFHRHFLDLYYKTFIGYVACNYFNLCTPLSVGNASAPNSFQITNPVYTRDRNELLFTYESPSVTKLDVSVYNILGERVYYSYDNDANSTSGEMRIRLNSGLASGGYFLVVKTREGIAWKPFFVIN